MFRALYDWTIRWAGSRHAEKALGGVSFVESSVFPIPADVLFVPMCLARPEQAMRYALIATVTSVLGGILGWAIGLYAFDLIARPMLEAMGKMSTFEALQQGAGQWAILLMLVTSGLAHIPPMKVVTILAGVVGFNFPLFVLAALVARLGKFLLLGWALSRYGAAVAQVIKKRLALVAGIVMVLGAGLWLLTH